MFPMNVQWVTVGVLKPLSIPPPDPSVAVFSLNVQSVTIRLLFL